MSVDVRGPVSRPEPAALEVEDLVAAVRPRLADLAPAADIEQMVRESYAELGPVRVTAYLPILIERRIKQRLRDTPASLDLRDVRVTA
jgi:hypothetical protein